MPLNISCVHPMLDKEIPIYIANFVLDNYGEGAIFGCPAHDERDYDFAKKYNLPIIKVINCRDEDLPFTGKGKLINSPLLNDLEIEDAIKKILAFINDNEIGNEKVNYKLRDWVFQGKDTGGVQFLWFIMKMGHIEFLIKKNCQ